MKGLVSRVMLRHSSMPEICGLAEETGGNAIAYVWLYLSSHFGYTKRTQSVMMSGTC